MKPKDPNVVQITTRTGPSFKKSNMGNPDCRFMSTTTRASSRNPFFLPHKEYVVSLTLDGFKIRRAGIDDRKFVVADKSRRTCVTGADEGLYDIVEQTEDYIICKKQKA